MTAASPRKTLASPRYPGWDIARLSSSAFLMTRPGGIFAISVGIGRFGEWQGTLLTMQRGEWKPAWTPYEGAVIGAVREADRRERWINKKKGA